VNDSKRSRERLRSQTQQATKYLKLRVGGCDVQKQKGEAEGFGICLAVLHAGAPTCCRRLAGSSFGHASSHCAGSTLSGNREGRGRRKFLGLSARQARELLNRYPTEGCWRFLEQGGAQCAVQLAKVFGKFGGPCHARTGLVGVFEAENFGVQGLTRKFDGCVCVVLGAIGRVIGAVADQGESGVGSLHANLMFSTGFQPEPQFGDEAFAAGARILGDDFVMRDGLMDLGPVGSCLRIGKDSLAQFVFAQL